MPSPPGLGRVIAAVVVLLAVAGCPAPASGQAALVHRPPVEGTVIDPFRPPEHVGAPGNRGVDLATTPGAAVRATAPGTVVFAGRVGRDLHVVVEHADGLRTSASFLASIEVRAGDRVAGGDVIGRSTGVVHLGVRQGTTYLDPLTIWGPGTAHAVLVPAHDDPQTAAELVADLARERPSFLARLMAALRTAAPRAEQIAHTVAHLATIDDHIAAGLALLVSPEPCTPPGTGPLAVPPGTVIITVAGFGSTSEPGQGIDGFDPASVGASGADVLRFSYGGGRVDQGDDAPDLAAHVPATTYGTDQSEQRLALSAERLAWVIDGVRAARPGAPVLVVGHSLGGVVAVDAAARVADPTGLRVVTIGSPHQGSSVASILQVLSAAPQEVGQAVVDANTVVSNRYGLDLTSPAATELSAWSDVIGEHRRRGVPAGVEVTSIAVRADAVVPTRDTHLDGARHTTVDGTWSPWRAHGAAPGSPQVGRAVALAANGLAPECRGRVDRAIDVLTDAAITDAEDAAAAALLWTSFRTG